MGSTESTLPAMEDSGENPNLANRENTTRRQPLRREPDTSHEVPGDDPWWWEIENENLLLDRVPNVTAERNEESGSPTLSDDFNTLLKIGENVNLTSGKNHNNNNSCTKSESVEAAGSPTLEKSTNDYTGIECATSAGADGETSEAHKQSLEEFKEELRIKRMARQTAVQDLREEITSLRQQLAAEKQLTRRLRNGEAVDVATKELEAAVEADENDDDDDKNAASRGRHANIELANAQLALQLSNSENLSLRTEVGVVQKQVGTLKEVVACCKQMLAMKEEQCTQLKTKLSEIEESFGEREMKIMSDNLRQEYERQLGSIRQLRQLYDERQRIAAAEHENLQRLISIKKDELLAEQERTKSFEERNQTLLKEVEAANNELAALRDECNEHKFEKKALKEEMGAVNTLFSQMVMGFNGKNNLDIDRLATMLEENRTLLNDMATKEANCSDGATLPKLLFELVEQAAVGAKGTNINTSTSTSTTNNSSGSRSPTPLTDEVGIAAEIGDEVDADMTETDHVTDMQDANDTCVNLHSSSMRDAANAEKCGEHRVDASQDQPDNEGATAAAAAGETNEDNGIAIDIGKKHHQRKSAANRAKMSTSSAASTASTASASASSSATFKFHEPEVIGKVASTQEIIGNLPKVWKVLMELLSHHKIEQVQFEENGAGEDCYKSVETPNGPKAELSVSKTYIKLKDLILEKKSLVKETSRLKTLNSHLDYRLNEQEKRLSAVSLELTKTWHLVGKMQRQHRQLHTQEQILRYQLQQKRRLLSELKDELEYCRRKWAAARAKNDESQEQCNDLRREFARRKLEDANNSAESGYSDSGPPSDEEERAGRVSAACCKSNLREMFEHSRKIKRMQSTSPGRAVCDGQGEIVLRWNSAPPTCGWRKEEDEEDDDDDDDGNDGDDGDDGDGEEGAIAVNEAAGSSSGAIPKHGPRHSRSKQRGSEDCPDDASAVATAEDTADASSLVKPAAPSADRAVRIQRLEEQCKSLIQQVLETSDNRERLEVQLCRFQDEISPVQYAIPLDEFISKKRIERMTRASSAPATGSLTPREEEYTRKRSERLGRLEEESRQLISRIKRTSDRGHYLRCSLERLHRTRAVVSREGSFESNTEEEASVEVESEAVKPDATKENSDDEPSCSSTSSKSPLTATEEAYTTRRAERLRRLEEESKQLLKKLSRNTERGSSIGSKLDALHEKYDSEDCAGAGRKTATPPNSTEPPTCNPTSPTIEKRMENIERISSNRDERLRILEEEGKQLISRLSSTSERGTRMINRIAEREQNRLARQNETPTREISEPVDIKSAASKDATPTPVEETPVAVAGELLPTLKNVACSSIVSEELAECVTVTTTPSQIARASQHGAVPKSKPLAQLSVAKVKAKSKKSAAEPDASKKSSATETLEEMVRRLQSLPFPAEATSQPQQQDVDEAVEESQK